MWKIGSVQKVKLGVDTWVPNVPNLVPKPTSVASPVSSLTNKRRNRWNANKIKEVFHPRGDAKEILNLPSPSLTRENALIWLPSHTGVVSVKSMQSHCL